MELIIGIIIVYLIVKFVVQPEYGLGCIRIVAVPAILFSFFGPIGIVVLILFSLYKKYILNDSMKEKKLHTDYTNGIKDTYKPGISAKEMNKAKSLLVDGIITQEEFEQIKKAYHNNN